MKIMDLYCRAVASFGFLLGITVVLDTFVLNQFLKNLMVKANTSSYSPYNTDGVANIIVIFFLLFGVPFIYYALKFFRTMKEEDKKPEEDEKNDPMCTV